jgi:hypothetical protein
MNDMKALSLALLSVSTILNAPVVAATVNFDDVKPGGLPPGWLGTQTGNGKAHWEIVADASAPSKPNVLKQSGAATYPICIKEDSQLKNGFVEVKFKPIAGKEDQAGGLVWRCQDKDNYYIARANALEDNVTIYYTIAGKRTEKKRVGVKVASNQWHSLRVDFKDNSFVITFDGKETLEWKDDTFGQTGKVGVWTKADSVTLFDDFAYGPAGQN